MTTQQHDDEIRPELLRTITGVNEEINRTHPHRLTVFWNNNKPGGISTTKAYTTWEGLFGFYDAMKARMPILDERVKDPAEIIGGLEAAGKDWKNMPDVMHAMALDLVFWLESRGHLKADPWNGCMFEWVTSQGSVVVCEGTNPDILRPLPKTKELSDGGQENPEQSDRTEISASDSSAPSTDS